jgi:hypothetical protein
MQKLILLSVFLFLYCFPSQAQRYADLEITIYAPATGDTIWVDNPFLIDAYIKNNGPDTVQFQDSLAFELLFDSSAISFNFGSGFVPYVPLSGQVLAPGDSTQMAFNFTLFSGWDTGASEICVGIKHLNTVDTMSDTIMANNRSCAMITVANPTSVSVAATEHDKEEITVYPNPASNMVTITSNKRINKAELYNMQGQKLVAQAGNGKKTVLDISQLPAGVYMIRVNDGFVSRVVKE